MAADHLQVALLVALAGCAADKSDLAGGGSTTPGSGKPEQVAIAEDPCAGGQVTGRADKGEGRIANEKTGVKRDEAPSPVSTTTPAAPPVAADKPAEVEKQDLDDKPPTVSGDLDVAVIRRVIKGRLAKIKACWDAKTTVHEVLVFTIAPDGRVTKAEASGGGDKLDKCVAGELKQLVFPTMAAAATVHYPMDFKVP